MHCTRINLDGVSAIVCTSGRQRRCHCGKPAEFQCDWRLSGRKHRLQQRTCDRYLCDEHALQVAEDKHLCPEHKAEYAAWLARRKAAKSGGSR